MNKTQSKRKIVIVRDTLRWIAPVPSFNADSRQLMKHGEKLVSYFEAAYKDDPTAILTAVIAGRKIHRKISLEVPESTVSKVVVSPRKSVYDDLELKQKLSDINEWVMQLPAPNNLAVDPIDFEAMFRTIEGTANSTDLMNTPDWQSLNKETSYICLLALIAAACALVIYVTEIVA